MNSSSGKMLVLAAGAGVASLVGWLRYKASRSSLKPHGVVLSTEKSQAPAEKQSADPGARMAAHTRHQNIAAGLRQALADAQTAARKQDAARALLQQQLTEAFGITGVSLKTSARLRKQLAKLQPSDLIPVGFLPAKNKR